ncbi:MAG: hypothetical protein F4076_11405 [Acidimicrobiaceae bacterium]|nr:hypothetical protein [Acidimicrobiaceae bacterium]MYE76811.1 hypothetical protein [Acidimicrobiaceae bacterium]MYJ43024.1 hypothetical protein [Acidimicrobiaceae bacterium]
MSSSASIGECRWLLRNMGFDRERYNERSALVLMALLGLKPDDPWAGSGAPPLRTVEIMGWIRDHWGVDYKPNTRETIRRQTLHQFVQAHLVVENPDEPTRPINSPKWCYQVTTAALDLIRSHGTDRFGHNLRRYLSERPGLEAAYRQERDLLKIPVTLHAWDDPLPGEADGEWVEKFFEFERTLMTLSMRSYENLDDLDNLLKRANAR